MSTNKGRKTDANGRNDNQSEINAQVLVTASGDNGALDNLSVGGVTDPVDDAARVKDAVSADADIKADAKEADSQIEARPPLYVFLGRASYPNRRQKDGNFVDLGSESYNDYPKDQAIYGNGSVMRHPVYDYPISGGLNMIISNTAAGKSFRAKELSADMAWPYYEFFEPTPTSETETSLLCRVIHDHAIIAYHERLSAIKEGREPDKSKLGIIIDSLKGLVYRTTEGGGAAGSGGVTMALIQQLSDISAITARCGLHVVSTINLTTEDDSEVMRKFISSMKASTAGLIHLMDYNNLNVVQYRDFDTDNRYTDKDFDITIAKRPHERNDHVFGVVGNIYDNSSATGQNAFFSSPVKVEDEANSTDQSLTRMILRSAKQRKQ